MVKNNSKGVEQLQWVKTIVTGTTSNSGISTFALTWMLTQTLGSWYLSPLLREGLLTLMLNLLYASHKQFQLYDNI